MTEKYLNLIFFIIVHMDRNKYQRLSKEEKDFIKEKTLEGKSLRYLSKEMDLGITTIYYQVRKFKPKQRKEFIVNLPEGKIGEIMGAFAGDGSYSHSKRERGYYYTIRFSLSISRDMQYAQYLMDLLKKLNLNPFLFKKEKENAMDITIHSKAFIEFIRQFLSWEDKKSPSIRLRNNLNKYSEDFLKGFVRGLMDTDGYVEISNVSCASISERLIKNLLEIFDKFGLKYKFSIRIRNNTPQKDLFLVRVYRGSLEDYYNLFGFSNNYKLDKLKWILNKKDGASRI